MYHRNVGIGWSYFDTFLEKVERGRAGLQKRRRARQNRTVLVIEYSSFLALQRAGGMAAECMPIPGCTTS